MQGQFSCGEPGTSLWVGVFVWFCWCFVLHAFPSSFLGGSSFPALSCWPCQLWVAPSSNKSSQCFWRHVGNRAGQQAALSPRIQRLPLSQKERPLSWPGVPDSASRPEPAPLGVTQFSLLQNTPNISNTPHQTFLTHPGLRG